MKYKFFYMLTIGFSVLCGCTDKTEEIIEKPVTDGISDSRLDYIISGFENRRDEAFNALRGKPLVRADIQPSISESGIPFYRNRAYSLIDYAFKCYWLNDRVDDAHNAIAEYCEIFLNIDVQRDRDSFYWPAPELCAILEYFGKYGSIAAGRVPEKTEDLILQTMYQYVDDQSILTGKKQVCPYLFVSSPEYSIDGSWDIEGSENHHIQGFYARWHFSKLLKEYDSYKNRTLSDGTTPLVHFNAWNSYAKHWIRERGRKNLFIEVANDDYQEETLKGIYNFYDFAIDDELHSLSGKLLDYFWADWAQEQLSGVRGGAKCRIYQGRVSSIGASNFRKLCWYYLGTTAASALHGNLFVFVTSKYRLPKIVMDIALDDKGRGTYEIVQRKLGLAKDGRYNPPYYRMEQEKGGLLRYSYCTPDFIMGSFFHEALPESNWTMISSQNRWVGAIFSGDPNSRIFVQCKAPGSANYNQLWSAQSKGTLIAQKLPNGMSKYANEFRIWLSGAGLKDKLVREGWVFVNAGASYAAVYPLDRNYRFEDGSTDYWKGEWIVPENSLLPVIIEVASSSEYKNYQSFQDKVISSKPELSNNMLKYKSISGDDFIFYTDYSGLPNINKSKVDIYPQQSNKSPFINSDFNSGVINITKGSRSLLLDFNK